MTTDIKTFLEELGLSVKEAELYICSLKSGPQSASTLSKKTGIARSTVNFIFKQLIQKGFAHKDNRENTTYFNVVQPESLEYVLLEKQAKAKKQLNDLHDLLPMLNGLKNQHSLASKVTYYDGLESLYRTVEDCCAKDESVYFISSHNNIHPKVRSYIERAYIPKAKKHKHKNKMILSDGPESRKYIKKAKNVYDEVIFVDPKANPFTLTIAIHGDSVDFISYDPSDLSGVIIENKLIAEQMKVLYKVIKKQFKSESSSS
jgi:sugar-specific transcriptional regulator TrmB